MKFSKCWTFTGRCWTFTSRHSRQMSRIPGSSKDRQTNVDGCLKVIVSIHLGMSKNGNTYLEAFTNSSEFTDAYMWMEAFTKI